MDDNNKNMNKKAGKNGGDSATAQVIEKIRDAESVLVALSSNPSVDEIAAAMGLSMALDSINKHVTAIYSGKTPNVLEFLKPEERFETGTESLQDFVIALNKDKADHLRYKIDGDFVKVYVTPYKTTISGDDIEFSRGDYNVDLVISLNVPAATDLDAALREHGRIMHDATSINITNGAAGKFGDLEWVDSDACSISEMVAKLVFKLVDKMDSATATALLTGLVAATDRFSSSTTTPDAMVLAAKLMDAGADQQLVVQNVQGEVEFLDTNNGSDSEGKITEASEEGNDGTKLVVDHEAGEDESTGEGGDDVPQDESEADDSGAPEEVPAESNDTAETMPQIEGLGPVNGGAEAPQEEAEPTEVIPEEAQVENAEVPGAENQGEANNQPSGEESVDDVMKDVMGSTNSEEGGEDSGGSVAEGILKDLEKEGSNVGGTDYGKMIDEALSEPLPGEGGIQIGENGPNGAVVNTQDVDAAIAPQGNPGAAAMPEETSAPMTPETAEEKEALDIINKAKAEADSELGIIDENNLPKIVPGGGSSGFEQPAGGMNEMGNLAGGSSFGNPAAENAPVLNEQANGANDVPDLNMGGGDLTAGIIAGGGAPENVAPVAEEAVPAAVPGVSPEPNPLPMPGQEMVPPPVLPQPDFGAMPPTENPIVPPVVSTEPAASVVEPVAPVAEPVAAPVAPAPVAPEANPVVVQPAMGAGGVPQMPQVVAPMAQPADLANPVPVPPEAGAPAVDQGSIVAPVSNGDPSAFKIPGIHV